MSIAPFAGTERYEIRRPIGQGGMGAVYEAFDRRRARAVAVKVLRDQDRGSLYRFKREFRAAADLVHPNLVQLYDLGVTGEGAYFFTMELMVGRDLVSYVSSLTQSGSRPVTESMERMGVAETMARPVANPARQSPPALAPLLSGVVEGLSFLHRARKVHRDLKPSNILVDETGTPRLLDFGILRELDRPSALTQQEGVVGTPLYMAPEQISGHEITPAADLYAFGCVLYELLAGHPPFSGGNAQGIFFRHLSQEPVAPSTLGPVDPVLELLCLELLQKDPAGRPTAPEVLERLHQSAGGPPPRPVRRAAAADPGLVGREAELGHLMLAPRSGDVRPRITVVRGESGSGKSALLHELVERTIQRGRPAFLGRCYEREQVPYKALDAIVDSLAVELLRDRALLAQGTAQSILPSARGAGRPSALAAAAALSSAGLIALARLFPVLKEVPEVLSLVREAQAAEAQASDKAGRAPAGGQPGAAPGAAKDRAYRSSPALLDLQGERVRALETLLLLLRRLSGGVAPLLCIEDLHWADAESLEVLLWLARAPGAPGCRIVATTRQVEQVAGKPLAELLAASGRVDDLLLAPLDEATMERLISAWVLAQDGLQLSAEDRRSLVREARGNALLGVELARAFGAAAVEAETMRPGAAARADADHAEAGDADQADDAAEPGTSVRTLADLLERRLRAVSRPARLAFEAASVAAGRATFALLGRATALPDQELAPALDELLRAQLLREGPTPGAQGSSGDEAYDLFHDRLREVAYGMLPVARRRALHGALAAALAEQNDPTRAVEHWRLADEPERARAAALEAAREAEEKLAFDRAAELYALGAGDAQDPEVELCRGRALSLAGRHRESAVAFEHAAALLRDVGDWEGPAREAALKAATERLAAGDFAGGMAGLDALLRGLGEGLFRGRGARIASILRHFVGLQVIWWLDDRRGLRTPRALPGEPEPEEPFRLRLYEAAFRHLAILEPLVSADFGVRFARLACRLALPAALGRARIGHALLVTGLYQTSVDAALRHLEAGEALCSEAGDSLGLLHGLMARALAHLFQGNWAGVQVCVQRGEALARRAGLFGEPVLMSIRNLHLASEMLVGNLERVKTQAEAYLLEAHPRGNVLERALPTMILGLAHLYAGDGKRGRAAVEEALALTPAEPLTVLRVSVELNRVALALFEENVEEGIAAIAETRRRWKQSGLLASSLDDVTYTLYGGRLLLLARRLGRDTAALRALDDFPRLLRRAIRGAPAIYGCQAARVLAALRLADGDAAGALKLLERALWQVERGHTPLEEHLLRYARGVVRRRLGRPGAALDLASAEERLAALGAGDFKLRVEGWTTA